MQKISVGFLVVIFVIAFAGTSLASDYVGASKCKICHKGEAKGNIYEIWEASRHAHAYETLVEKGEQENPECLACHVTGYNQPTGWGAEGVENEKFAGVGCEACHGPGSDYWKMSIMKDREQAVAAGLQFPTEAECVACHNEKSPTYKEFNFEEFYKKIEHKIPEATEE
jgi:hypothetical protein